MSELPNGWEQLELADCVEILDSKRKPVNNRERQSRVEGKLKSELYPYYGATGQVGYIDDYLFDEELVALGEDGVPFFDPLKHKAYIISGKTWVNNHAHVLKGVKVNNRYLCYYLNQADYHGYVNGATRLKLTQANMRKMPIKVAPVEEQKRIADKLDSVLAKVEAAQARLDKIPTILKRFRQSVLAAATSGELTKEWREMQHNHSSVQQLIECIAEERKALKTKKLLKKSFGNSDMVTPIIDDTPVNWVWCSFDDIAANKNNALKAGPFGSALKKQDCVSSGYKVYGQEQVISGNENLDTYFVDEEKFNELISCEVQPGDILISLVGTIGKVLVLSEKAEQGIINPRLVKLSLNPAINTEFIKLYLSSPYAMAFFRSFSHGGTMEILNLKILRKLPLCLPPIGEQSEIVNRVTELFEHAKAVESQYVHASLRLKKLSQSILSKAFKGEILSSSVDSSIEAIESSIEALNA